MPRMTGIVSGTAARTASNRCKRSFIDRWLASPVEPATTTARTPRSARCAACFAVAWVSTRPCSSKNVTRATATPVKTGCGEVMWLLLGRSVRCSGRRTSATTPARAGSGCASVHAIGTGRHITRQHRSTAVAESRPPGGVPSHARTVARPSRGPVRRLSRGAWRALAACRLDRRLDDRRARGTLPSGTTGTGRSSAGSSATARRTPRRRCAPTRAGWRWRASGGRRSAAARIRRSPTSAQTMLLPGNASSSAQPARSTPLRIQRNVAGSCPSSWRSSQPMPRSPYQ